MSIDDEKNHRESRPSALALGRSEWLLWGALVVVFLPALRAMSEVWSRFDYYSHGYLVPLAALWAATSQRHVLPRLAIDPKPIGAVGLALVLAVYAIGISASIVSLQGLAFVAAIACMLTFTRGLAWTKALGFPIGYLVFMVPLPEAWVNPLIAWLQLFVSSAAIEITHALALPVYRDGNVMQLPGGQSLFVAEACSGITSIVTLVPLAVFLAYFTQRSLGRRTLLVFSVIPLAMLGNLIRVVATIVVAWRYGVDVATGDAVHDGAGIATYVLGCLALLGVGALMDRLAPERVDPQPS